MLSTSFYEFVVVNYHNIILRDVPDIYFTETTSDDRYILSVLVERRGRLDERREQDFAVLLYLDACQSLGIAWLLYDAS